MYDNDKSGNYKKILVISTNLYLIKKNTHFVVKA